MKKLTGIIVVIVIIGAAIWFFKTPQSAVAPTNQTETSAATDTKQASDTTASITADLDVIDIGSADADFNSLNQDINSL